jgi:cell wall-associated NlpC family hydrolase
MFYRAFCIAALMSGCATHHPTPVERSAPDEPSAGAAYGDRGMGLGNEVAMLALAQIGIPYTFAGNSPERGFDCSGLVSYVLRRVRGVVVPRTTYEQAQLGQPIDAGALQPGDLVFFNTLRREFSHVGIYLGEARFIHAPTSGGLVRIEDLRSRYWSDRFNGARRFVS